MCKTKIQTNIYYNEINKCKYKNRLEEGYKTSAYFKMVLNKLKVTWRSYIYLYSFGDLIQRSFHRSFYVPTNKRSFLEGFLIINELRVN